MLVGDVPWEMFISSVKRLYIISGARAPSIVAGRTAAKDQHAVLSLSDGPDKMIGHRCQAMGKFQPKEQEILPAPLPVDSRLHSPQIDMSLKGSTQLSASPGVIVDLSLHKLTPVCSFHLNMGQKALWMIHIQKVQLLMILFLSQPPSAVQGLDEFHPEAIVQPNDTKFNEGLSLDTEVMQSVSSLVSTEIHSPRREQSKEIPSNASRGAFSISTLNSAPVELYPQLLTSQGMINPIFVLHAERFSGNDGVLQRDQQSSREEFLLVWILIFLLGWSLC
ncbi:hypothetical protein ACLOJK_017025 [Asimina triloba]